MSVPASPTILVAEDNDAVRRLVCKVLRDAGYRVLAASDGAAALELADSSKQEITLLLSDVKMPRLGGFELARTVQSRHPGILIVLMSANASDTVISDPAWHFLQKPFLPAALVNLLDGLLRGSGPSAPPETPPISCE